MERLYDRSSYEKEFTAVVTGCRETKERFAVTLDRTAFFPEGGGQPFDTGTLGNVTVLDVQEIGGEVIHYTDGPLEVGSRVLGVLDWERRFSHMQAHSGEHIITGCIHNRFGYDNVGFHMGKEEITIDFNGVMTEEELDQIEREANRVVFANLPIEVTVPDEETLKHMEYRSKKELTGNIRIATIPGVDVCACCGTHVARTGEVGLIKVLDMIHYKGGVRISLLCGEKALDCVRKRQKQIAELSVLLAAKRDDVVDAVRKLREEKQRLEGEVGRLHQAEAERKAASMPDSDGPVAVFDEMEPVQLRKYCTMLYEQGKGSIVLACSPKQNGGYSYVLGSSQSDMKAFSRKMNSRLEGKGGGSSLMAQGTFLADREKIESVFYQCAEEECDEFDR